MASYKQRQARQKKVERKTIKSAERQKKDADIKQRQHEAELDSEESWCFLKSSLLNINKNPLFRGFWAFNFIIEIF